MKTLKEKIFEKIETEDIQPKSKIYFKIKNSIAWILTIGSLLISSMFTSGIIFVLSNRILVPLPILLQFICIDAILFVILLYLSYRHFHKIKNSYRTDMRYVFVLGFIALFVVSFVFIQSRLYGNIDSLISQKIPGLSLHGKIHENWSHPENDGVLAGEVINIDDEGLVYLQDFQGNTHTVDPVFLNEEQKDLFLNYLRVRMSGFQESEIFYPETISVWEFNQGPKRIHRLYGKALEKGNIFFPNETLSLEGF